MNPKPRLTIRDVARMAGVSRSTVSLVINSDPRISSGTKARVLKVIQEAGYQPNTMARRLARRKSETVAVVLPKTDSPVFADVYFAEAISGVSAALGRAGYRLLIEIADERFLARREQHRLFQEGAADGMLLLGTTSEDEFVQELIEAGRPLVLVNSRRPGAASVVADNRTGMRGLVLRLAELGHRRIGFIGGLEITTVGEDRSLGFLDGLSAAGIPFREDLRLWGNFSEESGAEGARVLLRRPDPPTALVAANDMMAIGALRVAQDELGLAVPNDLTVVGADDIRLTTYVRPRLTTLSQPIFEIGRRATEMLLGALAAGKRPQESVQMPTSLVLRESSGAPRGR